MPTISMFYGVIVRMYATLAKSASPHIHAYYQDFRAIVNLDTCEVTDGSLPPKQTKLVLAWAEIHKDDLMADWALASRGESLFQIEPLK